MHTLGLVVVVVVVVVVGGGVFVVVVVVVLIISLIGSVVKILIFTSVDFSPRRNLYTANPEKIKTRNQIEIKKPVLRIVNLITAASSDFYYFFINNIKHLETCIARKNLILIKEIKEEYFY